MAKIYSSSRCYIRELVAVSLARAYLVNRRFELAGQATRTLQALTELIELAPERLAAIEFNPGLPPGVHVQETFLTQE